MKTKWGSGFKIQPALNPQAVCPASAAQRGRLFLIFTQDLSGLAAELGCRPYQERGSLESETLQDFLGLEHFSRHRYSAGL